MHFWDVVFHFTVFVHSPFNGFLCSADVHVLRNIRDQQLSLSKCWQTIYFIFSSYKIYKLHVHLCINKNTNKLYKALFVEPFSYMYECRIFPPKLILIPLENIILHVIWQFRFKFPTPPHPGKVQIPHPREILLL